MIRNTYILKTLSLFLSFWMLTASTGLSVDFHYCEGKIVDWSISGSELICEHEKSDVQEDSCCKATHNKVCDSQTTEINQSDCCKSGEAEMNVSQNFNLANAELDVVIPLFVSYPFQMSGVDFNVGEYLVHCDQEVPPTPKLRRLALIQSFLL